MSKITVRIAHVVPVMDYGNTTLEATLEFEAKSDLYADNELQVATEDVRRALGITLVPMVNAEVERCMSVLVKEANVGNSPDTWMRKNSKMYQWFKLVYPEVVIPAMDRIDHERKMEVRRQNPLLDLESSH